MLTATGLSAAAHVTNTLLPYPDLAREVSKEIPDVKVDFMRASSYGAASESSGDVTVKGVSNLAKWENYNIVLVREPLRAAAWCCCSEELDVLFCFALAALHPAAVLGLSVSHPSIAVRTQLT